MEKFAGLDQNSIKTATVDSMTVDVGLNKIKTPLKQINHYIAELGGDLKRDSFDSLNYFSQKIETNIKELNKAWEEFKKTTK